METFLVYTGRHTLEKSTLKLSSQVKKKLICFNCRLNTNTLYIFIINIKYRHTPEKGTLEVSSQVEQNCFWFQ